MARNFFDNLPSTRTPVTAPRMNALLDGDEPMGNIVVDSIRSKNMLDVRTFVAGTTNNTTGELTRTGDATITQIDSNTGSITFTTNNNWIGVVSDFIEVDANTTYYLSKNSDYGSMWYMVWFYDSTKTGINKIEPDITSFTTPSNAKYIRIILEVANNMPASTSVNLSYLQLETGSTATTFAPYQDLNMNKGTILFEGLTNQATINLYDNLSNYSYIDIEFGTSYDGYTIQRFDCSNNAFNLCLFEMDANAVGNYGFVITENKYANGGTSINYVATIRNFKYQQDANWVQDTGGQCIIKKVIGYK
jgi:hypothetical protein